MRSVFVLALSAIATLAAAASRENPFNIPSSGYEFTAGEPTTLSWDPTTEGTVTLKLQWGDVLSASSGTTIASGLPNSGSFIWSVPASISDRDDYTIEIVSDSDPQSANYLPRFSVVGAEEATTTTTTTTTQTTTTETETSTTETPTTLSTTTSTRTTPTETPTPTSTTSSAVTHTSTSTTTASSTTTTETSSSTPTSVPSTQGNNAMSNRISGAMMALVVFVAALI